MTPSSGRCSATIAAGLAVFLSISAAPSAHASQLLGFAGAQYETAPDGGPDPTPGVPFGLGDQVVFVGHVTGFRDDLLPYVDPAQFEYTIVVSLGTVVGRSEFAGSVAAWFGGDIAVRVYEDAIVGGTAAVPTPDPPNTDVPSSFSDGTMILGGLLPDMTAVFNTERQTGQWETLDIVLTEGTLAAHAGPPAGQALGIGAQLASTSGPAGFTSVGIGEIRDFWIDPVEPSTWGALKALYR